MKTALEWIIIISDTNILGKEEMSSLLLELDRSPSPNQQISSEDPRSTTSLLSPLQRPPTKAHTGPVGAWLQTLTPFTSQHTF